MARRHGHHHVDASPESCSLVSGCPEFSDWRGNIGDPELLQSIDERQFREPRPVFPERLTQDQVAAWLGLNGIVGGQIQACGIDIDVELRSHADGRWRPHLTDADIARCKIELRHRSTGLARAERAERAAERALRHPEMHAEIAAEHRATSEARDRAWDYREYSRALAQRPYSPWATRKAFDKAARLAAMGPSFHRGLADVILALRAARDVQWAAYEGVLAEHRTQVAFRARTFFPPALALVHIGDRIWI